MAFRSSTVIGSRSIAPSGDFMSHLVAARNVIDLGQETRAGLTFTRYAFEIDGPTFALSIRQQTEEAMRRKGDVLLGVTFAVPAYYRDMIGSGELWVDEDGLPQWTCQSQCTGRQQRDLGVCRR